MGSMAELKVEKKLDEKEVEKLTEGTVTEEKIEDSLNYDKLTPEEKKAVDEFNAKIDVFDQTQVLQFGAAAQNKISQFSDSVLDDVKTKDIGETGKLLAELVAEIKSFDGAIVEKKGLSKLFSSVKKEVNTIVAKYNKIEKNVDTIEGGLEKNKVKLLKDITVLETLYNKNLDYFKEVSLYIIAGERKIKELKEVTMPELKAKAEATKEQLDIQKVQDLENTINRLEKKIYDLKTTRLISIQMAPQIRLLQSNDSALVEKIQGSITNTIPLWKNQMVLALGITNAKSALKMEKAVTDLTNDMLVKNSETLKQGSIDIAKESERAIVDIETLRKTNSDIITTLDEVIRIHEEGQARRAEATVELENIEKELKEKLVEIQVNKA